MADTTSAGTKTTQNLIDEQYENLKKAQKANLDAGYAVSKNEYESQLEKSDETYQPLRNEAYVNNALAERARRENMANMGLSGEGGTSLSLQQRHTGNMLSTLGDISRQQQGYKDEIDLALANLDTTYQAGVNSMDADTEAQRIAAQLAQGQFDANYGLSADQLALQEKDSTFSTYYQLYKSKLITKKQFEQQTGIDLK
jgi:hypothetical protein